MSSAQRICVLSLRNAIGDGKERGRRPIANASGIAPGGACPSSRSSFIPIGDSGWKTRAVRRNSIRTPSDGIFSLWSSADEWRTWCGCPLSSRTWSGTLTSVLSCGDALSCVAVSLRGSALKKAVYCCRTTSQRPRLEPHNMQSEWHTCVGTEPQLCARHVFIYLFFSFFASCQDATILRQRCHKWCRQGRTADVPPDGNATVHRLQLSVWRVTRRKLCASRSGDHGRNCSTSTCARGAVPRLHFMRATQQTVQMAAWWNEKLLCFLSAPTLAYTRIPRGCAVLLLRVAERCARTQCTVRP